MYLGGAFQARVHLCTLGYMRVAGQLWLLLKTVKQLAGTIKATMAQVICTMGFKGVWDLYPRAVVCLPSGFALGKTYNCPRVQIPYTLKPMVQI